MREKKQADWEERRRLRLEREKEQGGEGSQEKNLAGESFSKRIEEEEMESSSEDEGWCEGVPAFKGTSSVVIDKSNDVVVEDSLISDDEDHENIEKSAIDSKAVIEEKEEGDLKKEEPLYIGEKAHVVNKTSETVLKKQDPSNEVSEEGLDKAELSADNDSDVDDIKSDLEQGGSSDEAPEEIKIVKCYENEEDSVDANMKSPAKTPDCDEKAKPSRKRKRKAKKSGAANETEAVLAPEVETDSMPVKKEKVAESKAKVAKVTRQSVLEQRIRPPTLLERLLLQEIKKERNTILQCVRYVCKNNFFEANKST